MWLYLQYRGWNGLAGQLDDREMRRGNADGYVPLEPCYRRTALAFPPYPATLHPAADALGIAVMRYHTGNCLTPGRVSPISRASLQDGRVINEDHALGLSPRR